MSRSVLPGLERQRRERTQRVATGLEIVHLDASRCPTCATPIVPLGWAQPALFYFGGYGATTLTVRRRCAGCGWSLPDEHRSVSPRR